MPSDTIGDALRWEWKEAAPSVAEVLEALGTLPPVWGVKTLDYASFVLPMTRNEKITVDGQTRYVPTTKLYMQVAGRVKMLNEAQETHEWFVRETETILQTDPVVLQFGIEIGEYQSDGVEVLVGTRLGISKAAGGDAPWEKMETAARGRALGAWGFGVLPGSGIASLDEMQIIETIGVPLAPATEDVKKRSVGELYELLNEAKEELRQARGQDGAELDAALIAWVKKTFGKELKVSEDGIDWSPLNKGKLLLVHSNLQGQIEKEGGNDGTDSND